MWDDWTISAFPWSGPWKLFRFLACKWKQKLHKPASNQVHVSCLALPSSLGTTQQRAAGRTTQANLSVVSAILPSFTNSSKSNSRLGDVRSRGGLSMAGGSHSELQGSHDRASCHPLRSCPLVPMVLPSLGSSQATLFHLYLLAIHNTELKTWERLSLRHRHIMGRSQKPKGRESSLRLC